MLTICKQTVYREPLLATESVAKVKRFSESTRENASNFPKYMGYRTKQHYLCNIFLDLGDKHEMVVLFTLLIICESGNS